MEVKDYALFPTRLVTIEFVDVDALNDELCCLFERRVEFADGFNMHPDALNLLSLADAEPAVARLRDMFIAGLNRWLEAEGLDGQGAVDLVLFSNYAAKGEFTTVHNHNADLVGVYYARVARPDRPTILHPGDGDDYFEAGNGVLVLHDPRFNANLSAAGGRDYLKIFPHPGLMLIFPAYVWHSVTPNLGEHRRLSFSMNFTLRRSGGDSAVRYQLG